MRRRPSRAFHVAAMVSGILLGAGLGTSLLADRMITGGGTVRDSVGGPAQQQHTTPALPRTQSESTAGGANDVGAEADAPYRTVTARDLARRIDDAAKRKHNNAEMMILDGNSQEAFVERHIPGAVLMASEKLDASKLPADHHAFLAFTCDRVRLKRCDDAARAAVAAGYRDVVVIPDGNAGWKKLGRPLEKG